MRDRVRVSIFCEDRGHEQFVRPLVERLAREIGGRVATTIQNARGGRSRALAEFQAWQRSVQLGAVGVPDLVAVVVDTNCGTWADARRSVEERLDPSVFPRAVIGCPDPHVERWCLADPRTFQRVVGIAAPRDPGKCERDAYKHLLADSLARAGKPIATDEMEIALDIVDAMDLHRAVKKDRALGAFVGDLRTELTSLMGGRRRKE